MTGKTLMDRERSENIRQTWILDTGEKEKWNEHIDRKTEEGIVNITRHK